MKKAIREIRIEGEIAFVPLTMGYEAVIDAEDVPLVVGFYWWAQVKMLRSGGIRTVYAIRSETTEAGVRKSIRMHRVIAGTPTGMDTDHADCDGLNNRRYNLRNVTTAQNNRNARIRQDNISGVKGVCIDKSTGNWRAFVRMNGIRKYSSHPTLEDAASAAERYRNELHGEFGRSK